MKFKVIKSGFSYNGNNLSLGQVFEGEDKNQKFLDKPAITINYLGSQVNVPSENLQKVADVTAISDSSQINKYNSNRNMVKSITKLGGLGAGLYLANRMNKGTWGYVGFGILGYLLGGIVGGQISNVVLKSPDSNTPITSDKNDKVNENIPNIPNNPIKVTTKAEAVKYNLKDIGFPAAMVWNGGQDFTQTSIMPSEMPFTITGKEMTAYNIPLAETSVLNKGKSVWVNKTALQLITASSADGVSSTTENKSCDLIIAAFINTAYPKGYLKKPYLLISHLYSPIDGYENIIQDRYGKDIKQFVVTYKLIKENISDNKIPFNYLAPQNTLTARFDYNNNADKIKQIKLCLG
jgi:hypothetical protein